ncbi:hypothetical protein H8A99_34005 [Bradyrhizobium sp. Arg68]|uniref:hypothetical protein n=1 Tax=Bradyrhizobium ivorense TaxID=2511166 RepID=UPI001E6171CB|nr:hypothetical protein [Bradyrhizobium ivorense]MCC8941316.1 hypothetical protein [Bradyrhizobium ivorense]
MFEKLAKFRPFEPRRVPRAATHCNDNLPGVRHPARRQRPAPALTCHWLLIGGHLECRWTVDDSSGDLPQRRRAGRRLGPRVAKIAASA